MRTSVITGRSLMDGWKKSSEILPKEDELVLIRVIGEDYFTVGKIYPPKEGWLDTWKCVDVILGMKNTEWASIEQNLQR